MQKRDTAVRDRHDAPRLHCYSRGRGQPRVRPAGEHASSREAPVAMVSAAGRPSARRERTRRGIRPCRRAARDRLACGAGGRRTPCDRRMLALRPSPPDTSSAVARRSPSAPTFVIERIVVEGVRHGAAAIVAAETLLTIGQRLHGDAAPAGPPPRRAAAVRGRGRFRAAKGHRARPLRAGDHGRGDEADLPGGRASWREWRAGSGGTAYQAGRAELAPGAGRSSLLPGAERGQRDAARPDGSRRHGLQTGLRHRATRTTTCFGRHLVGSVSFGAERSVGQDTGVARSSRVGRARVAPEPGEHREGRNLPGPVRPRLRGPLPRLRDQDQYSYDDAHLTWQSDTTDDPFTPREGRRLGATLSYNWGHTAGATGWVFRTSRSRAPGEARRHEVPGRSSTAAGSGRWRAACRSVSARSLAAGETRTDGPAHARRERAARIRDACPIGGRLSSTSPCSAPSARVPVRRRSCWWELTGSLAGAMPADNGGRDTPYDWRQEPIGRPPRSASVLALRGRWGIARFAITYRHGLSSSDRLALLHEWR